MYYKINGYHCHKCSNVTECIDWMEEGEDLKKYVNEYNIII